MCRTSTFYCQGKPENTILRNKKLNVTCVYACLSIGSELERSEACRSISMSWMIAKMMLSSTDCCKSTLAGLKE